MRKLINSSLLWLVMAIAFFQATTVDAASWRTEEGRTVYEETFEEKGVKITLSSDRGSIPEGATVTFDFSDTSGKKLDESKLFNTIEKSDVEQQDPKSLFNQYNSLEGSVKKSFSFSYHIYYNDENGNKIEYVPSEEHPVSFKINNFVTSNEMDGMTEISVVSSEKNWVLGSNPEVEETCMEDGTISFDGDQDSYIVVLAEYRTKLENPDKVLAQQTVQNIINGYCDETMFLKDPYSLTEEQEKELKAVAEEQIKGCTTQEQKIRALTDYVSYEIYYDYYYLEDESRGVAINPYEVYTKKATVCSGYAALFQCLCVRVGIPCMEIIGENHAYNYAYDSDNDRWLAIDTTWRSQNTYNVKNGEPVFTRNRGKEYYTKSTNRSYYDMNPQYLAGLSNHEVWEVDYIISPENDSAYYMLRADISTNLWSMYDYSRWGYMDWDMCLSGARAENLVAVEAIEGLPVNNMSYLARNDSLRTVDLSATSISAIRSYGFSECSKLEKVILPDTVVSIGAGAFRGTSSLKYIEMPNVTSIGNYAFSTTSKIETAVRTDTADEILNVGSQTIWGERKAYKTKGNFNLVLDGNGSNENIVIREIHMDNVPFEITENTFTKTGYEFAGWNSKKDGSGDGYIPGSRGRVSAQENAIVTWYAQWEKDFYSISFEANLEEYSGRMEDMKKLGKQQRYVLSSNAYSKKGYRFKGWNTKADGSGTSFADGGAIRGLGNNGDTITLYAQWELVEYSITYDLDGGINDSRNVSTYTVEDNMVNLYAPTKEGYVFRGWNLYNCYSYWYSDEGVAFEGTTASDITATADWIPVDQYNHKITFDGNGATGGETAPIYDYGTYLCYNSPYCGYIRPGYSFVEWNSKPDGSGTALSNYVNFSELERETTYYAIWKEAEFTLYYYALYNNIDPEVITFSRMKETIPNPPAEEGYDFLGWYLDTEGKRKVTTFGDITEYYSGSYAAIYSIWKRSEDGYLGYIGRGLVLDSDIIVRLYLDVASCPDNLYYKVGDGSLIKITKDMLRERTKDSVVYQCLDITIKPTQLMEKIEICQFEGNDSITWPCGNAFSMYSNGSWDSLYELVTALDDYGTFAQLYFGVDTENLPTSDMITSYSRVNDVTAQTLKKYAGSFSGSDTRVNYLGSSLQLENRISVRHYFSLAAGTKLSDVTVTVDGKKVTPVKKGDIYYVEISDITPANLADYSTTGIGNLSIKYSAFSYIYDALTNGEISDANLINLLKAIYLYGTEAKRYVTMYLN